MCPRGNSDKRENKGGLGVDDHVTISTCFTFGTEGKYILKPRAKQVVNTCMMFLCYSLFVPKNRPANLKAVSMNSGSKATTNNNEYHPMQPHRLLF